MSLNLFALSTTNFSLADTQYKTELLKKYLTWCKKQNSKGAPGKVVQEKNLTIIRVLWTHTHTHTHTKRSKYKEDNADHATSN